MTDWKSNVTTLMTFLISIVFHIFFASSLFALTDSDIASYQKEIADKPLGERIALWAEKFVGSPYDPDPLGDYVTRRVIVADERVDCMYLTFRAVELALGQTPEESLRIALDKRFLSKGILEGETVVNYEDRFQYGEDMIDSGKWGKEITKDLGPVTTIKGTRGKGKVEMLPKDALIELIRKGGELKDGDIIFFIKAPEKRVVDEVVGHIGIIKLKGAEPYLIHASGKKVTAPREKAKTSGEVKKVLFYDYASAMPFVGVKVGRFP